MLISRCEFSITSASATLMEGAKYVPAVMTLCIIVYLKPTSRVEPEVRLYFSTVCSLSPGLMRSGE
jgi:hypothetical protein